MLVDVVADHVVARRHRPHRQRQPHVALPDDDHGLGGHGLHHDRRDHPRRPRARFLGSVRSRPTYPRRTVPSMSAEPPAPLDRRALLRRMAIGGAAVWATPMMQSVASAQAAAQLRHGGILDWDTFTTGSIFTNTIIGNTTITMAISGVTDTTLLPNNRQDAGGPGRRAQREVPPLRDDAQQGTAATTGRSQTITFAFSVAGHEPLVPFFDIDALTNGWRRPDRHHTPRATPGASRREAPCRKGTGSQHQPVPQQPHEQQRRLPPATQGNLNSVTPGRITSFRSPTATSGRAGRRRTSGSA